MNGFRKKYKKFWTLVRFEETLHDLQKLICFCVNEKMRIANMWFGEGSQGGGRRNFKRRGSCGGHGESHWG